MKLSIAGTFTVNTVEDGAQGAPSPYYHDQKYAWSAQMTTINSLTAPSDIQPNAWSSVIPTQESSSMRFLWVRDILMTYDPENQNANENGYVGGQPSYARLNGEDGTGFHPKGSVPTIAELANISPVAVGDAYLVEENGHLYVFNGSTWTDFGVVKGDNGLSAYVHLAWANTVGAGGYPTGGNPDGSAMGFTTSKAATESFAWMGVYTDNNPIDSQTPSTYTWSRIRGLNRSLDLDNENDTMLYNKSGSLVSGNVESTITLYEDGAPVRNSNVTYSITAQSGIPQLGATISVDNQTYIAVLTVRGMTADSGYVVVQATYQGQNYAAMLTLKRLVGQEKYTVITTPNAIAYNLTTATPASTEVFVNITRLDSEGNVSSLSGDTIGNLTLSVSDGTNTITPTYDSTALAWKFTAYGTKDEYTVMLKEGNVVHDQETIPINKSANGDDAVRYYVQLEHDNLVIDYNVAINFRFKLNFFKQVGNTAAPEAISKHGQIAIYYHDGTVVVPSASQSVSTSGMYIEPLINRNVQKVTVFMLDTPNTQNTVPNTYLAKSDLVVTVNGQQGEQGIPGNAGKDIVRLDLDNQMDAIQYRNGTQITNSVVSHATLYEGTSIVSTGMTWGSITATGCTAQLSGSGNPRSLTVTAMSAETGTVTVPVTYKGVTYTAVFTVVRFSNADKYELNIVPDTIAWNEDTDTETQASPSVTIKIKKYPWKADEVPNYITDLDGNTMTITAFNKNGGGTSTITPSHQSSSQNWTFVAKPNSHDRYEVTITKGGIVRDTETVPVARVRNGEQGAAGKDAIRLHLDNQMDAIQYNGSGKLRNNDEVLTHATLYQGGTPVSANAVTWSFLVPQGSGTGYMEAPSTKENPKEFGITAITGTKVEMTITATYNQVAYTAVFTAVKLVDTDKYQIELTPKSIAYNGSEAEDENYPFDIRIKKWSAFGGDPVYIEDDEFPSNSVLKITAYDSWGQYSPTTVTPTHVKGPEIWTVTTDCEDYDSYEVELVDSTNSDLVYDHQTLPISRVYNGSRGSNGQDALVLDLSNEMDSVPMDYDGYVLGNSAITLTTQASMYYGATPQTLTALTASIPSTTGVSVSPNKTTGIVTVSISPDTMLPDDKLVVQVTASCSIGGTTRTRQADFTIQGVRAGAEGDSPTIYQLSINTKEIKVDKNGTRVPQESAITVKRIATTGTTSVETNHGSIWYVKDGAAPVLWIDGQTMYANRNPFNSAIINNITFRYYDGSAQTSTLLDSENIPVVYDGADGEDPYWIDIQTRTTKVDKNGDPYISITWYVRKGNEIIPNNEGWCYLKLNTDSDWTGAGVDERGGYLFDNDTVDGSGDALTANTNTVLIRYDDNNNVTRASISLPITRDGIDGGKGADAMTYEIRTNIESIAIPSDQTSKKIDVFSLSFWKTVGANAATAFTGGLVVYKRSGSTYYRWQRLSSLVSSITFQGNTAVTIDNSSDALVLFLNDSLYTTTNGANYAPPSAAPSKYLVKKEIPILKNGDTGQDGAQGAAGVSPTTYDIVVTNSTLAIDASGTMRGAVNWKLYQTTGTTRSEIESASNVQWKLSTGMSALDWKGAARSGNTFVPDGFVFAGRSWKESGIIANLSGMPTSIEMRYLVGGDVVAFASSPFSIQGQMGRNYYYDGEWSASKTYTTTDYSAPFVSYTHDGATTYWAMEGINRSISGDSHAPSSGSADWYQMEDSFKYLITEAIFTDFAKLGSAVFNGDYMFSQKGYIVGYYGSRIVPDDESNLFQYVLPDDMDGEGVDDTLSIATYRKTDFNYTSYTEVLQLELDDESDPPVVDGRYYTIDVQYVGTATSGTTLSVAMLRPNAQGTANEAHPMYDIEGELKTQHVISTSNSGIQHAVFIFKWPDGRADCYLRMKVSSASGETDVEVNVTAARFAPMLYINLRTGQMVANDLTARGMLYASSVGYSHTQGSNNNETLYVRDASFVVLPDVFQSVGSGKATVMLPSPSPCKGRVIEVFASGEGGDWYMTWVGATSTASFGWPWGGSGHRVDTKFDRTVTYAKVYSDGTIWRIMKIE